MIVPITSPSEQWRELDARSSAGIDVTLLWCAATARLLVTVVDRTSGESFELEVREGESALEVYRHPYPFAEARGLLRDVAASRRVVSGAG